MNLIFEEIINESLLEIPMFNRSRFTIKTTTDSFTISINKKNKQDPLDPFNHNSIIALGRICEYLRIASAHRGFVLRNELSKDCLNIKCQLIKYDLNSIDTSLYDCFQSRLNNEKANLKQPKKALLANELLASNDQFQTKLNVESNMINPFYRYLYSVETAFFRDAEAVI